MEYSDIVKYWQKQHIKNSDALRTILHGHIINFAYHSGIIENPNTSYDDTREIFENDAVCNYTGDLSDIPHGWFLCDGTHGTPDLRDRFLTGAGLSYNLGNIGGENKHMLTKDSIPPLSISKTGFFVSGVSSWALNIYYGHGSNYHVSMDSGTGVTIYHEPFSSIKTEGGNKPHENRPPYYAVYYIVRIY